MVFLFVSVLRGRSEVLISLPGIPKEASQRFKTMCLHIIWGSHLHASSASTASVQQLINKLPQQASDADAAGIHSPFSA